MLKKIAQPPPRTAILSGVVQRILRQSFYNEIFDIKIISLHLQCKSAYMPDENNLHFNAIGEGTTAKEAYDDFMAVVEAFRADFPDEVAELHFDISYDLT